jgi:hypothetical protein
VFAALEAVPKDGLLRAILIRNEPHTILQALQRSLTHCAYHVGQIVFIAKMLRSKEWQSLSIPRQKSGDFNARMGLR